MTITFSDEICAAAPQLRAVAIEAEVQNPPTCDALWDEIAQTCGRLGAQAMETVNKRPAIAATRAAYKALGKDPNRYRPSAEAMTRRAVKGLELYRSTTLVDLINLLSLASGHSIGGFDADAVEGDALEIGRGREGEPYEAIGRGQLNIEGLPVLRDSRGGIGTPTSDNDRTKMSGSTRRLLMVANLYGPSEMTDDEFLAMARRLLGQYAGAADIKISIFSPQP